MITSNIRGFYGYVRSKKNPADDPTRGVQLRLLRRGETELLDRFLVSSGHHWMQLSGLPDQRELLACKQLELRSSLDERREKRKEKRRQTRRERPREEQDVELEKDGGSCGSLALKLFYHSGAEAQRTEERHIEKTLEVEPRRRI